MLGRNQKKNQNNPSYVIKLTNISENETFCYSLPIVKGYVRADSQKGNVDGKTICLKRLDPDGQPDEVTGWPVINGIFKCLANLNCGRNRFVLEFENCRLPMILEFEPRNTGYHVLPVYIICSENDGRFQAPDSEDNSPRSACRRISLGSRLIQSLTAEKLHESDLDRRTFCLARDLDVGMDCAIFNSKLKCGDVYAMEPEEIWEHFGRELMSSPYGNDRRKFLAFLSCTRYASGGGEPSTHEEVVARVRGHVALGGGGLAVFGTGCLHTWPETIDQILPRFTDATKIDKLRFMDDSCYRGTYGGCFSTTLGAVCHELGHAFDLGHSKRGIMGRGFDDINLVFTAVNDSKIMNKNAITRNDGQHATVCFTRNLSVTYTMSSPVKKAKGHLERIRHASPQRRISMETHTVKTWNPECWSDNSQFGQNEKKMSSLAKVPADDLTFWEKSCAVMLRYHKWFSRQDIPEYISSSMEFDRDRFTIHSTSGIRVVELRGDEGLILASWVFISTYIPKQFTLPMQNIDTKDVKMIVAEDSSGNIIKERLAPD